MTDQPDGHRHSHGPRFESLAVFATVTRSPAIARVLLALLLFYLAEVASWIAILVYAFDRGGTTGAGVVAFVQLAPCVVFAPLASALGDRLPRIRMLAIAYAAFAASTLLVAVLLAIDADPLAVYAAAIVASVSLTLVRPAHASVLPTIARTPSELTAANVASGTVENIGVLAGSVGGGLLLAAAGAADVFLASGVALALALLAVVGMRPATVTRRRRIELALHEDGVRPSPLEPALGDVIAGDDGPAAAAPAGVVAELLAGLVVLAGDAHTRAVVVVLGVSAMLVGVLDVLGVVLSLDVLHAGEEGVGLIAGALGAGGLLGAGFAIALVGRHRLLGPLMAAGVVAGAGIAVSGLVPVLALALVGFTAGGLGKSVFDVAGRTMLQRVAPDATLARVFGVLEGLNMAMLAIGTLAAPVLVQLVGIAGALVVSGALVPVVALALRPALLAADRAGVVHEQELSLIRQIPMFAPLRVTALERLAQELDHMHVRAGADVIRQGEVGDRFYLIAEGHCEILVQGRRVNTIGPGEGFGEIALLNDVPRTATVRALDDLDLFVLDRAPFLEAVTGQPRSRAAARDLMEARLAMHR